MFTKITEGKKMISAGCSPLFVVTKSDVCYMNILFCFCYLQPRLTVNLLKTFN